jgi:hypothetical protein
VGEGASIKSKVTESKRKVKSDVSISIASMEQEPGRSLKRVRLISFSDQIGPKAGAVEPIHRERHLCIREGIGSFDQGETDQKSGRLSRLTDP